MYIDVYWPLSFYRGWGLFTIIRHYERKGLHINRFSQETKDEREILMIKLESWIIELLHSFFSRILSCPCGSLDVTKDKKMNFDLRALPVETGSWKWYQKFRREKLRGGPGGQIEAIWLLSPWKRWFRGECTHMYIVGAHGLRSPQSFAYVEYENDPLR